jgi:hypothetical protein
MVSLDVCSDSLALAELSSRIGISASRYSHERGELRPGGRGQFNKTIWRIDSNQLAEAPLRLHLESIVAQCPPERLFRPGVLANDCSVYINIGQIFDTAYGELIISPSELELIRGYRAELEISCYPGEAPTT